MCLECNLKKEITVNPEVAKLEVRKRIFSFFNPKELITLAAKLSKADFNMVCVSKCVRFKKSLPEISRENKHRIYSYLPLKEVALTIMKLSTLERKIFEGDCAIARENKIFKYEIPHENCLLHGKAIDNLMKKLDTVI